MAPLDMAKNVVASRLTLMTHGMFDLEERHPAQPGNDRQPAGRGRSVALTLLCLSLSLLMGCAVQAAPAPRPNIILIFTDDQRHDAVGYAGNEAVHTPNLDRLARAGLIFRNCFVNTSICAVSRANIITGQYPARHGVDDFFKVLSNDQLDRSVPGRLREAGYQTAFFGKWGIGNSLEKTDLGTRIFDYWAGQPKQTNYFHEADCCYVRSDGFQRPVDNLCDCPADARGKAGVDVRIGKANLVNPLHVDATVIPHHVERFLDGRETKKPFCLMLFFKSPHAPFIDWDTAVEHMVDDHEMKISAAATLANARHEPEIIRKSLGWPTGQRWLKNTDILRRHIRDYYRCISSMDLGVGRVMEAIENRGLQENTVVLFTSDNGHFFGEHGLSGKWLMYESSLRVPGFIYDPRTPGGKSSDRMVITTDFSVTMLALAGIDIPPDMSGRDLNMLYSEPDAPWREDFLYDHPYSHRGRIPRTLGVRTERYVYTRYIDPVPHYEQFFDLRRDPEQLHNLADTSQHPELLGRLRERCDRLTGEVGPIRAPTDDASAEKTELYEDQP